jgi:predicted enzyme related to lactoylglutathione lyase
MCLGLMLVGAAATVAAADLPPLSDTTPSQANFPGKFIWADLFTTNPTAAQAFYTGLFGWEATTIARTTPSGRARAYIILKNGGEPVAGIALRPTHWWQRTAAGRWVGYVSVPDVPKALVEATAAGGRVLFPARTLPRRGTQAIFVDPEGATLGLLHASAGDPGEYAPDPGDWTWTQLFAHDPAAEGRFYASVTGWEILPAGPAGQPERFILASGNYSRGSVAPLAGGPKSRPDWILFVRVTDVKASVAQAVQLGGKVLVPPGDEPARYWRAVIADPTGAVIGLVQLQSADQPKEQP